jgi:hypothetical protein
MAKRRLLFLLASARALEISTFPSRRIVIQHAVAGFTVMARPYPGNAVQARGAAELDLEYYARDLVLGNPKEGSIQQSRSLELPPPRTLKEPLLSLLLSKDATCVPAEALLRELKVNDYDDILRKVDDYRAKSERSFYARAPWKEASLSDQYYFDLSSYAHWRTLADVLPDYRTRDRFARQVGRLLLEKLRAVGLLEESDPPNSLVDSVGCVERVLSIFVTSQFCKGFRVGESTTIADAAVPFFDSYDDEALQGGATVNCLVSVFEPATLGASLQITAEQSRFTPEYVAPTLAAMWESVGIHVTWETFFVDNEYRPNPKDFFPNEQLIQLTLSRTDRRR